MTGVSSYVCIDVFKIDRIALKSGPKDFAGKFESKIRNRNEIFVFDIEYILEPLWLSNRDLFS